MEQLTALPLPVLLLLFVAGVIFFLIRIIPVLLLRWFFQHILTPLIASRKSAAPAKIALKLTDLLKIKPATEISKPIAKSASPDPVTSRQHQIDAKKRAMASNPFIKP